MQPSRRIQMEFEAIEPAALGRQRAEARVSLAVARLGETIRSTRVAEAGSLRVRMPRGPGPTLEAVLINTGGGIACGDRFSINVEAGRNTQLVLTTPAAERAYRSDGATAEIAVRLTLASGADLAWMPQETIVFDRARLKRCFEADLAANARLLLFEAVVFGRMARGEDVNEGFFEDRWRIRRNGRLVYADTLRFTGPVARLLDRPALAGGARALATLLYVAPDAESRIEEARGLLEGSACLAGASAWNGLWAIRFLGRDGAELRRGAARFLVGFRGCPLPRVWQS
jgi:urease accessory protein